MESISRKQLKFPVSAWLLGGVSIVVVILMVALSIRIYEVFVDPRTINHRWTIIDNEYKYLLSLALVFFMLVPALRLTYIRAQLNVAVNIQSKLPVTWGAIEKTMTLEE